MKDQKPRILFIDIETSANLGYVWQKWETNVIEFAKEWQILSVAWKWNSEKTQSLSMGDVSSKDDKPIVCHIWKLFQESDIIVAHNGDSFDIKKCKARFVFHKLKPCKRLSTIDTKKVAKNGFSFNSNSLDDLGKHLGVGRKVKHEGFSLWLKCMAGDKKALEKMAKYNRGDVDLLYKVYKRLRPWIQNHPSLAAIKESVGCPNCGSSLVIKNGVRANHTGLRQQMRCKSCGGWYLTRHKRD